MSKTPLRLTAHDVLLLNLAAASLIAPLRDDERVARDMELIAETLPRVTRDTIRVRDLADACEALVAAYPLRLARMEEGVTQPWHAARFAACMALEALFDWRAAEIIRQLAPPEPEPEP